MLKQKRAYVRSAKKLIAATKEYAVISLSVVGVFFAGLVEQGLDAALVYSLFILMLFFHFDLMQRALFRIVKRKELTGSFYVLLVTAAVGDSILILAGYGALVRILLFMPIAVGGLLVGRHYFSRLKS